MNRAELNAVQADRDALLDLLERVHDVLGIVPASETLRPVVESVEKCLREHGVHCLPPDGFFDGAHAACDCERSVDRVA